MAIENKQFDCIIIYPLRFPPLLMHVGGVHGAPLGSVDLAHVKTSFNFDPTQTFAISDDVKGYYTNSTKKGIEAEDLWNKAFLEYTNAHPELSAG